MSSNLLKSAYISVNTQEKRIIDTNQAVADKIAKLKINLEKESKLDGADGFVEGLDPEKVEVLIEPEEGRQELLNESRANAENILNDAKKEAEELIGKAIVEAEQIREFARKEGTKQGQQEGYEAGHQKAIQELKEKEKELIRKEEEVREAYEKKAEELEVEIVETLTGIYEEIFRVDLKDQKQIVLYLLQKTISDIGTTKDLLVHLSKEDYGFISMNKKQFAELVSSGTSLEFVEDHTLNKNQCYIETSSGIFDCSVGSQMEELNKKLKLLSYEK